jgi:hypothetical protein
MRARARRQGIAHAGLDREIWTAANLIIKRLGASARREVVERAGDMLVRGDAEGHVVWLRIYRAIIELQLPPTGTKH